MSYSAKSGRILSAGATQLSAIVQLMAADSGTVGLGSVTVTSWPAVWLHIPGLASGTITLSTLASATADFAAGGVFYLGGNEFRLDFTVNGAATALVLAAKNASYELNVCQVMQVGDSANTYFGTNALTLGGAAITLGLTGSTLTLNGTAITLLDPAGVTTLLSRITSTRAGYLDNLNVGGLVASAAAVLNIQNNTFIASDVPYMMERPDVGSETVPITFIFCDDTGAAKDLDSGNPVLTLTNNAGTDLSARLAGSGATWTHVGTGEYKILYTNTSSDAIAELVWKVTGTINAVARKMVYRTQIVDTTAIDFTSSDRTDLQTILARQPSASGAAGLNTAGEYQAAHGTWPGETAAGQAVTGISGVQSQVEALQEDVDGLVTDMADLGDLGNLGDLLIAGRVTVRSPVLSGGRSVLLVRGDDYTQATGQALEWTDAGGNWPTLDGGTVTLTMRLKDAAGAGTTVGLTQTGTIVVGSGSGKLVRFEPVHADTESLTCGNAVYRFDVEALLATGERVTLVLGDVTVLEDQTR